MLNYRRCVERPFEVYTGGSLPPARADYSRPHSNPKCKRGWVKELASLKRPFTIVQSAPRYPRPRIIRARATFITNESTIYPSTPLQGVPPSNLVFVPRVDCYCAGFHLKQAPSKRSGRGPVVDTVTGPGLLGCVPK
jgi:hypothetical protein